MSGLHREVRRETLLFAASGGPCTLERCCSGLVCKGQGHPDPACCHPDEAFCADGGCCNRDCCGGTCCKDEEDCVNGACKRKCLSSQISCGDSSCCTPPDQCISGKCVGPCGSTAVRCGTANPPRCCHSGTVCCESEQVCCTPGATNCPHTVGRHIITVCPAVANTGLCCYKSTSDVVDCGFETVCPDSYIAKPLFECPD